MGAEELGACLCAVQGGHTDEYLGWYADVFHGLGAAFGVAVHDGLSGHVRLETLFFKFLAAVLLGVSLDDGHEPCTGGGGGFL